MTNDKWQMTNQEIDAPGSSWVTSENDEHGLRSGIRPKPAASEGADVLSVICHLPFVIPASLRRAGKQALPIYPPICTVCASSLACFFRRRLQCCKRLWTFNRLLLLTRLPVFRSPAIRPQFVFLNRSNQWPGCNRLPTK